MNTGITANIPLSQPYNTPPWNYSGTETLTSVPAEMVDWVLIELYDTTTSSVAIPSTMIAQQAALLMFNGNVRTLDGTSLLTFENVSINESLFVVIRHRNHLPVLSANALFSFGGPYYYNFKSSASQAYDGNLIDLGNGNYGMIAADINVDGTINLDDLNLWKQISGQAGYMNEDTNLDSQVGNKDKNDLLYKNQGASAVLPE